MAKYPSFLKTVPIPQPSAPPQPPTDRPIRMLAADNAPPPPPELKSQMAAAAKSLQDDTAEALKRMAALPPADLSQAGTVVPIEQLPPAQQQELREAAAQVKAALSEPAPRPAPTTTTVPTMPAFPPTTPTNMESPPEHTHTTAGGNVAPEYCPRCLWVLSLPLGKPADADRAMFVSQVAQPQGLFRKSYQLLGGRIEVKFRDLYARETDLIDRQIRNDTLEARTTTEGDYLASRMLYRMVCAIEHVMINGSAVVDAGSTNYAQLETPAGAATVLPAALEGLEDALGSVTTMRMVMNVYREFSQLVDNLQAEATNPDFYSGIAHAI